MLPISPVTRDDEYISILRYRTISTEGIDAAVTIQGDKLIFTWTPDLTYAHGSDRVMLLGYSPVLNEAVYKLCGEKRETGTDVLILSDETWRGKTIETYLSFISENGIKCTNSIYLGTLIPPCMDTSTLS